MYCFHETHLQYKPKFYKSYFILFTNNLRTRSKKVIGVINLMHLTLTITISFKILIPILYYVVSKKNISTPNRPIFNSFN